MNLNFYQPDNNNYLENLRNTLNDQINKLDQLRNVSLNVASNNPNNQNVQPLQPQRYYLDCGVKEDWEEFLKLNYNITETQIFEDYRLFLQAKTELHEDANKEKLEQMKSKLAPKQLKEERMKQYASNNTNANNQLPNANSQQTLEKSNNNNQNKGGKHVR